MGNGSIAAAGAVIIDSLPQDVICAGMPARIVKRREHTKSV